MSVELSLRERKKAATRAALGRAAMLLAVERGPDGVTVEAIADAAGVSPRTFHNYFPGKEEAIVACLTDGAESLIDGLRARPADEPVWESLRLAVRELLLRPETREETGALLRLVRDNPALFAQHLSGLGEMERRISEVIAARTGTDADRDLYPHLLAGSVGNAMRTAADLWASGRTGADLADLVDEAFARLRAGLPGP
ncbi:TetR family transcriptional regulator [Spirillospora sp. NPDC127200]